MSGGAFRDSAWSDSMSFPRSTLTVILLSLTQVEEAFARNVIVLKDNVARPGNVGHVASARNLHGICMANGLHNDKHVVLLRGEGGKLQRLPRLFENNDDEIVADMPLALHLAGTAASSLRAMDRPVSRE